tara:strand:- start:837 stop:2261 length:1425 start_codon:yes stop_codon:yes gene_type:complete
MSLILNKEEINIRIQNKKINFTKDKLTTILKKTFNNSIKIIKFINFRDDKNTNSNIICNNKHEKHVNPLLWQFGHVIFFYINLILKNLHDFSYSTYNKFNKYIDFYDSHKTPLINRNGDLLIEYDECFELYIKLMNDLEDYINLKKITNIETYLIMLGLLHNEMHNEAFIFTNLYQSNLINIKLTHLDIYKYEISKDEISKDEISKDDYNNHLIKNIEFIDYNGGTFIQGHNYNTEYLVFDNESPQFEKKIDNFKISKYPITEYQYLLFIKSNGYINNKYWSRNGYLWKERNNISLPLYWVNVNNNHFKKINNTLYSVNTNLPITNISYYEAEAYCNWKGVRLPNESEFEFISTNEGKTKFPWGNQSIDDHKCNLNYNKYIVEVNKYEDGDNYKKVSQLLGNVWEWCQEPIYPYDGFEIDPVYREMSYPFFGYKKICRGGCFAVPDYLIHTKYRNAQYPDCRIQFIGFRVCSKN